MAAPSMNLASLPLETILFIVQQDPDSPFELSQLTVRHPVYAAADPRTYKYQETGRKATFDQRPGEIFTQTLNYMNPGQRLSEVNPHATLQYRDRTQEGAQGRLISFNFKEMPPTPVSDDQPYPMPSFTIIMTKEDVKVVDPSL